MDRAFKMIMILGLSAALFWAGTGRLEAETEPPQLGHLWGNLWEGKLGKKPPAFKIWPIARKVSSLDTNGNGVNDTDDIISGGRLEVLRRPVYRSAYYRGGYPPETEGVCTDVIWRAFRHAGYELKDLIDADIKADTAAYPRTNGKPDPHIDFRRVPNQKVFFQRHGLSLTTELKAGDLENLGQWQPGDIVTFKNPDHIAILSTIRNDEGLPYLIHNDGPWAREDDDFAAWHSRGLTGHYRFPKK